MPTDDLRPLTLRRRGPNIEILAGHVILLSSAALETERELGRLAGTAISRPPRRVLIGGLGFGATLRGVLEVAPADARVVVAEKVSGVVDLVRGELAHVENRPLDDGRVAIESADVLDVMRASEGGFDAILLDVDNGPGALIHAPNGRLYDEAGLRACRRALRPGGVMAVWSTGPDPSFVRHLAKAGFEAEERRVTARTEPKGIRHVIFLGRKPGGA